MSKRSPADDHGRRPAVSAPDEAILPSEDPDAAALEAESIGLYLSRQRQLRGISVAQLGELTRIPIRSLERLEAGHFDEDIDGFVRGFVRTVAQALGLDPDDALARMLAEPRIGEPDAGRPMSLLFARSLVGLVGVALLVLAFGVVRGVLQRDEPSVVRVSASPGVWRSDPVRTLAEANAAQPGGAPPALSPTTPSGPTPPITPTMPITPTTPASPTPTTMPTQPTVPTPPPTQPSQPTASTE